jgi:hypothetical protein
MRIEEIPPSALGDSPNSADAIDDAERDLVIHLDLEILELHERPDELSAVDQDPINVFEVRVGEDSTRHVRDARPTGGALQPTPVRKGARRARRTRLDLTAVCSPELLALGGLDLWIDAR